MESDASADFIFAKPVCATFFPVIRLDTISPDSKAAVVEMEWVCLFEPDLSPSQAKLSLSWAVPELSRAWAKPSLSRAWAKPKYLNSS